MTPLADVRRALVVGAGTMGHGIAQVFAKSGITVDLVDTSREILDRARDRVEYSLAVQGHIGVIPEVKVPVIARRIAYTTQLDAVARESEFVIEAIVEDRDAKRALFTRLDGFVRPGVVIASNTSGLNVFDLMAEAAPGRLPYTIIHHYFLPPTVVPLVEVVRGPETDPAVVDASIAWLERLGQAPVLLDRFHPNFIVNSFQVAIGAVAARLLQEGVASPEAIDRAVKHSLGIRLPVVGVVQTYDFTGLPLLARILRNSGLDASYFEALVAEGRTGVGAGRGLYDYGGRTAAELEAERDAKYWQVRQHLQDIGAFDPVGHEPDA